MTQGPSSPEAAKEGRLSPSWVICKSPLESSATSEKGLENWAGTAYSDFWTLGPLGWAQTQASGFLQQGGST